jgi:peptidoglycan/xylan/chitin deacetylase (PgdA/CDA1 family)
LRILAVFLVALLLLPVLQSYGSGGITGKITTCDCVAFRLDDIQDYFLNNVQVKVIETFEQRNASLTVGVIANNTGNDTKIVSFLEEKIRSDRFDLDVANHGLNHEDFTLLDTEMQSNLLSASNEQIFETLGVRPSVFIPPFNYMNEDTLLAAATNGIDIVSSGLETEIPFVRNMTGPTGTTAIFHFPRTSETGDISTNGTEWFGYGHQETMQKIEQSIDSYGYAVVMMHPQEFSIRQGINFQNAVDDGQLAELESLLDSVQNRGYRIRTISDLADQTVVPEFPVHLVILTASALGFLLVHARIVSRFRKVSHLPL